MWECQDFSFLLLEGFHKTNRFRSSLRTWQFHYVVVSQTVNFETKLWISRRISLGCCEVRVIWCSWFGNITTKECKQSENNSQPSGLFYDVNFWNVNYLRYRGTPHHRRMARPGSILFTLVIEWIRITRSLYANEAHNILITSFCTHVELLNILAILLMFVTRRHSSSGWRQYHLIKACYF